LSRGKADQTDDIFACYTHSIPVGFGVGVADGPMIAGEWSLIVEVRSYPFWRLADFLNINLAVMG
jgi:hypothetical protein